MSAPLPSRHVRFFVRSVVVVAPERAQRAEASWCAAVAIAVVKNDPSLGKALCSRVGAMGLLTFALNVTLDGCCDHREILLNRTGRVGQTRRDGSRSRCRPPPSERESA